MHDVVPTKSQDTPTSGPKACISFGVVLTIEQPIVERSTIDLHHELCATEEEIDAPDPAVVVTEVDLPFRLRKPKPASELDETGLELTLRRHVPLDAFLEQLSEQHRPDAPVLGEVVQDSTELRNRRHLSGKRSVQGTFRASSMNIATEVEERPRDRRAPHPVDDTHVGDRQRQRLLETHGLEGTPTATSDRDRQWLDREARQLVHRRSTCV
jgi:hypothetical protein